MKGRSGEKPWCVIGIEPIAYHSVDNVLELHHDHALHRNGNLLAQITSCNCITHTGNVLDLSLKKSELFHRTHAAFEGGSCEWSHGHDEGT